MSGSETFDGVREHGKAARASGVPLEECPYRDYRKADGKVTFSRAFRNAWRDGWLWQDKRIKERTDPEGTGI